MSLCIESKCRIKSSDPLIPESSAKGPLERREGVLSCGNKYRGLQSLVSAFSEKTAKVPLFFGLPDAQLLPLLRENTLALWDQAGSLWGQVSENLEHSFELENLLEKLQQSVKNDLLKGALSFSEEQREALKKCKDKKLIVRSSSNEDSLEVANAGGNLSLGGVDPEEKALKDAIANVVASYFSYPSLKNRSNFEDPFKALPLCGVLVMEFITSSEKDEPVMSGIMMTHKPSWIPQEEGRVSHISASWGFGHGVASGKVPCDEWIITDEVTYPTIRNKPYHLVAGQNGKLIEQANSRELRESPTLDQSQVEQLRTAAQEIEDFFKAPMEVEFVFQKNQLYIVQAKPVKSQKIESPTFLGPGTIPKQIKSFCAKTVLSGSNQVMTLPKDQILFARDLEEADLEYKYFHRAVILLKEPQGANSHAEVNLLGQPLPVLCFVLSSQEEWDEMRRFSEDNFHMLLCPQTGLLLWTKTDVPVRKGLFVHPAKFPISVTREERGTLPYSNCPKVSKLKGLITATSEQIQTRLQEVEEGLKEFFREINSLPTCLGSLQQISKNLQNCANEVFRAMQKTAASHKLNSLSFHATALGQLLEQVAPQVIGAHSMAELEDATRVSSSMEAFFQEFKGNEQLLELALFGKKAFDASIEDKWLSFLRVHQTSTKVCESLLSYLKELDQVEQISLWFSYYFRGKTAPEPFTLLNQDEQTSKLLFFSKEFISHLRFLKEKAERAESVDDLQRAWENVKTASEKFFSFFKDFQEATLFQELQITQMLYELVQLWDFKIKTIETSKIAPDVFSEEFVLKCLSEFASFGKELLKQGFIKTSEKDQKELQGVLAGVLKSSHASSRPFSVQHWLVPGGMNYTPIDTNDQRLTVIHQNLLKAIGPQFEELKSILPPRLASAVEIFRSKHKDITKRFKEDQGIFANISNTEASVILNIPLNYHSFVLTIKQVGRNEKLQFIAEWRGSDNDQGSHLPLFETLSLLKPELFVIESSCSPYPDLKVVFSVHNELQAEMVSKAIFRANCGSVFSKNPLKSLALVLYPGAPKAKTSKELDEVLKETKDAILDQIWEKFKETEETSAYFQGILEFFAVDYLKERNLMPLILEEMAKELKGEKPGTKYLESFGEELYELSLEKRKDLFWKNLLGPQHLLFSSAFGGAMKGELLIRLKEEFPEKFKSYCAIDRDVQKCIEKFEKTQSSGD